MGFKRTTEGHVYFKGSNDSASKSAVKEERKAPLKPVQQSQSNVQVQILSLLKALNERLKTTQNDRHLMREEIAVYRKHIEDLEGKADQSERAYLELEQKVVRKEKDSESRAVRAEKMAQETMNELEETRKLILDIEDKADQADKGVLDLKTKVGQTYKISEELAKKQNTYNALLQRVQNVEERHDDLTDRVEDSLIQQDKLMRRIDKAIEDRSRFMRKIERIEETVLQTRDALNAKAMVLLTDQGVAGHEDEEEGPFSPAAFEEPRPAIPAETPPPPVQKGDIAWWRKPLRMEAMSVVLVILAALLLGWFINKMQTPSMPNFEEFEVSDSNEAMSDIEAFVNDEANTFDVAEGLKPETDLAQPGWETESDTSAFSDEFVEETAEVSSAEDLAEDMAQTDQASNAAPNLRTYEDDIGALDINDESQVLALLEKDPDRLAAELNKLEPSAISLPSLDDIQDEVVEAVKPAPPPVKQASLSQPKLPNIPSPTPSSRVIKSDSNLPDVIKKIEAQAFEGTPEAQHDLAAIYTAGHGGVRQNYIRAAHWFEKAAEQGVANAAYNLGVLNHQGLGMLKNIQEAIRWYGKAAEKNHPEAQYNLGIAYIEGIGVQYNANAAATYFKNAAEQGVMEASYNLGLIYENGLLGEPQPDIALMWYKDAADQGSPEAKAALDQLAKALNIELKDVEKLVENMKAINKTQITAPQKPLNVSATAQQESSSLSSVINTKGVEEQVLISQIQEYLVAMGLYPGPADGVNGPLTQDAIRSYQAAHRLDVTGVPTNELLTHMFANVVYDDGPNDVGSRAE